MLEKKEEKHLVRKESVKRDETLVYIGPFLKEVVSPGTCFKKGILPARLEEACKKEPAIRELLIPVSKVAQARKNLGTGALRTFCEKAKYYKRGE